MSETSSDLFGINIINTAKVKIPCTSPFRLGTVMHTSSPATQEDEAGESLVGGQSRKVVILCPKINNKKGQDVAQE